jgi:protein-S-isoprenylcysteine O-methyltransferase Ste14
MRHPSTVIGRVVSRVLVFAQFLTSIVLLLPIGPRGNWLIGGVLIVAGLVWLGWTLRANPPGNFRIFPEIRSGARLITQGTYRWVRHPMYFGVVLGFLGVVVGSPALFRAAAWLALVAVLVAKARIEEAALRRQFPEYAAYCRARRFLVPGLW